MFDRLVEKATEALMRWCVRTGRVLHITGTNGPDDIYLIRYYLVKSRWFNVFIHQFLRSDRDDLHDHPWNFATYLVRGAYTEHKWSETLGREEKTRRTSGGNSFVFKRKISEHQWQLMDTYDILSEYKSQNRLVFRRATDQHKVMTDHHYTFSEREFAPLTICLTGPTIRTWGFIKNEYFKVETPETDEPNVMGVEITVPLIAGSCGREFTLYRPMGRKWVEWREYLGLPPDAPGRG